MVTIEFLVLFFMLFISLFKINYSKLYLDPLDKDKTQRVKGILSLVVMFGHLLSKCNNDSTIELIFIGVGYLCVGIFFFYSGFSLNESYQKKINYLDNFISKKIKNIYFPFFLMNIVYLVCYISINKFKQRLSILEIIEYIIGLKMINSIAWYIYAILYFYLLFYISFKYFFKYKYIIFLFSIFIYVYLCIYINKDASWWYISVVPLYFGVIYSKFGNSITRLIKRFYTILLLSNISFFILCYFLRFTKIREILRLRLNENVLFALSIFSTIFICSSLILILTRLEITNKISLEFGKISLEIYLYHGLFMNLLRGEKIYISNNLLYVLICVFLTIICSKIMFNLKLYIINRKRF